MNTVLLIVSAALAAWLYLVGLALDLFWLKLLTKPWLVVALAVAVWRRAGTGAGRRIAWSFPGGSHPVRDVCAVPRPDSRSKGRDASRAFCLLRPNEARRDGLES